MFHLAYILIYTIYFWYKSYILQVITCFVSFYLLLIWIIAVSPFVLFGILYLLLLSIYVKTKSNELFFLWQILQFQLSSWSVWQRSSAKRTLKTCGRHSFFPETHRSLWSAYLEPIVTTWHIFMPNILKGCSSGVTQLTL